MKVGSICVNVIVFKLVCRPNNVQIKNDIRQSLEMGVQPTWLVPQDALVLLFRIVQSLYRVGFVGCWLQKQYHLQSLLFQRQVPTHPLLHLLSLHRFLKKHFQKSSLKYYCSFTNTVTSEIRRSGFE